jgi:hypothetical protein
LKKISSQGQIKIPSRSGSKNPANFKGMREPADYNMTCLSKDSFFTDRKGSSPLARTKKHSKYFVNLKD